MQLLMSILFAIVRPNLALAELVDVTKLIEPVEIRLNISYAANSLWTEPEIRSRFALTNQMFQQTCPGISISINEIIKVDDTDLQDFDASLSPAGVEKIKRILARYKTNLRPTIFYVRGAKQQTANPDDSYYTEHIGKAFTLGGPRPLIEFKNYLWNDLSMLSQSPLGWQTGNLDWERFEELRPLHGTMVIAQGSSVNSQSHGDRYSVDRHELGHILLNDGDHRHDEKNFMSDGKRTDLDKEQCELIRAYYQMEKQRDAAIISGMKQLCTLYEEKKIFGKPRYCN